MLALFCKVIFSLLFYNLKVYLEIVRMFVIKMTED